MIVNVSKLQQIMSFVVLAAVIVAGVQCSNHEAEKRVMHNNNDSTMRIKAQSRISMTKGGGYGARVQIREDNHGRKHAHAMAICDCNGQGPWRPLFKPSEILKSEFPEHEAFHEEIDTHYRNLINDHVDNNLRSPQSPSSEHISSELDSGGFSGGGISYSGGGYGSSVSGGNGGIAGGVGTGIAKKHNHMIHLHLIPHIYVPIVHSAGFPEVKNYHATVEDESPLTSPVQNSEFQVGDVASTGGVSGPSATSSSGGTGESPASATTGTTGDHDHSTFNGHSGETTYYTISDDTVQHLHHQDLNENYGNGIDSNQNHDYEVPSNAVSGEPHQYQVHETDDLTKDYSNKNQVTSVPSTSSASKPTAHHNHYQPQQTHKHRNAVVKPNRAKHGRKLSSRQDLKNLLVMRPPPIGQTQTWRYVYRPAMIGHHQPFYQSKQPIPLIKTRTVPLILHIRQRSDDD